MTKLLLKVANKYEDKLSCIDYMIDTLANRKELKRSKSVNVSYNGSVDTNCSSSDEEGMNTKMKLTFISNNTSPLKI